MLSKASTPLASLEASEAHPHKLKFDISPVVTVDRFEINSFADGTHSRHTYHNEPGQIEAHTIPLDKIDPAGGERSVHRVADYVMELLWGKIAPGSGISESAVILGVSRQRVHQLVNAGKMPKIHTRLAATPVWRTPAVIAFALERAKVAAENAKIALETEEQRTLRLQIEKIKEHGYKFGDLTSPNNIVVREHFDDFRTTHPEFTKTAVTRTFHTLLFRGHEEFGHASRTSATTERPRHEDHVGLHPISGIVPISRSEINFPTYGGTQRHQSNLSTFSKIGVEYGIVAGSVPAAYDALAVSLEPQVSAVLPTFVEELRAQLPEPQ